jgi:hypothetical protein
MCAAIASASHRHRGLPLGTSPNAAQRLSPITAAHFLLDARRHLMWAQASRDSIQSNDARAMRCGHALQRNAPQATMLLAGRTTATSGDSPCGVTADPAEDCCKRRRSNLQQMYQHRLVRMISVAAVSPMVDAPVCGSGCSDCQFWAPDLGSA